MAATRTKESAVLFADLHNHMLFGVDDGAKTEEDMQRIIEASYADGVRHLCFTPHHHPGFFGHNTEQILISFQHAQNFVKETFPDLNLYLGNELRYDRGCTDWVRQGQCSTLNGTRYLLVDFLYPESAEHIMDAMRQVLNTGYLPVLAHAERYENFHRDLREVERLRSWGVRIQIDAQSPLGGLGFGSKKRSRRILSEGLADVIASDAHDLTRRPPQLYACFDYVAKNFGYDYARYLFWDCPLQILGDEE